MTISRDQFIVWVKDFAGVLAENKEYLTGLDSAIGDADHGINMDRGFQAVLTKLPAFENQDIGSIAKNIGMVLISTVGGASGPLYGTLFMQLGKETAGKLELTLNDWITALDSAVNGVMMRGKANLGDKTMLDTLIPALNKLKECAATGASLEDALREAEKTAEQGMLSTVPLVARKGRASYLGERSAGAQDPGATSSYYLLKTAAHALGRSA
ncbi:MAG TPA: dihydroxyacetone kinase subunit DhaL [Anaerolineales bacterium]|nr:dihydroxyacetone kinase subunit DhaL [Anaerolineales bacterium]